jgi:uncharacterized membrane protein
MIRLYLGVVLFIGVHLIPTLGREFRDLVIKRIGENPYKGLFSLALILAIALMVIGWRSVTPDPVYFPPAWGTPLTSVLMLISVLLFCAAHQPTRIRRFVRHPQLTGVAVWSTGHLISNGDSRSLVLFGGLGLWALFEIGLINKREGAWVKPYSPTLSVEVRGIFISAVIFFALVFLHPYFAGVSPIPR